MKTPVAFFCLTGDCVATFIGFEDFVLKCIFDGVGFARVFKLLKLSNEVPRETLDSEGSMLDIGS